MPSNKIETISNVAILSLCVLISFLAVWKFVLPHDNGGSRSLPIGRKLTLSDVDLAAKQKTIVLAIDKHCHFCTEDAPLFRELISSAHRKNIAVIAVLPQSRGEASSYLSKIHLEVDKVVSSSLRNVGVTVTPTVLLVDRSGVVIDGWVGVASSQEKDRLLGRL